MKTCVLICVLVVVLPHTSAQSIGDCSAADLNAFISQLPNAENCNNAIKTIFVAGNASDSEEALNTFCTPDCGQAYAEFIAQNCSEPGTAMGSVLFCLPADVPSGPTHCLTQLYQILENRTLDNLARSDGCSRYNRDSRTCPANCSSLLQKFSDAVGCCYQGLYNDTGLYNNGSILNFLTRTNFISNDRAAIVRATLDPFLWNDCNVTLKTSFCSGNPYPGQRTLISGVCPLHQLSDFVSGLNSDCSKALLNPAPSTRPERDQRYDVICTKGCAGEIANFQNRTCQALFDSTLNYFACYKTEGSIGTRCAYSVANMALRNASFILNANTSCSNAGPNNCPDGCQSALTAITKELGCCYQTLQNNTKYLDTSVIKKLMNFDERVLFHFLSNRAIWEACEVPIVKECTGDPFEVVLRDTAVKVVSSMTLTFFTACAVLSYFLFSA